MHLLALLSSATACPTIATGSSEPLSFDIAQVAIVREGTRTTFSVSINPVGTTQQFALVLPVPEVLDETEVRTLDADVFPALDGYSAPRHVSDAGCPREDGDSDADSDLDTADDDNDSSVEIEAEYLVGEYEVTILSAEESESLQIWLDSNGYSLPAGADAMLAEYIEGGSYFLAAKVADSAAVADGSPLSPLQIAYDSDIFSIPIRLATLNSPGEQEMVIYAIDNTDDGRVGISNYPEFEVPKGCIWGRSGNDDFAAFYDELYTEAWYGVGDAAWAVEFSGDGYSCNPCTGITPTDEQITQLGFTGGYDTHFLTRIHMRYSPAQADQDLMLYASNMQTAQVTSYADDYSQNYICIDSFCDGTPTKESQNDADTDADSDSDSDADADTDTDTDTDANETPDGTTGCAGCSSAGSPEWAGLAAGVLASLRRRRSR